jgi:hypothetical protein
MPLLALQLWRTKAPSIPWSFLVLAKLVHESLSVSLLNYYFQSLSIVLIVDAGAVLATAIIESVNGEQPRAVQFVYPILLLITMVCQLS